MVEVTLEGGQLRYLNASKIICLCKHVPGGVPKGAKRSIGTKKLPKTIESLIAVEWGSNVEWIAVRENVAAMRQRIKEE